MKPKKVINEKHKACPTTSLTSFPAYFDAILWCMLALLVPLLHAPPLPGTDPWPPGCFPPISLKLGPMTDSVEIPLGGPAALTTSDSSYLPGRAKYCPTLCFKPKHSSVSSQQCMRPVMGRIPAVIFWLLTVAFPHNRAIRRPENQHHGEARQLEGPSGQNYVADGLPQDPSVWNQATPGATKWYQDQDCGGEGLALDLP